MPRQSFPDFLDSPSRGSPRGRGGFRGGAGGGGGYDSPTGGRGGRGSGRGRGTGGGRGRGGSLKADYTAVRPIDYSTINKENYKNLNGYNPSPYENAPSTPARSGTRARGTFTPTHRATPPQSGNATPSSSTQVLGWSNSPSSTRGSSPRGGGLGFGGLNTRGRGGGAIKQMYGDVQNARGFKQEKTAGGRKVVDMGAPIFVKAGTLFADEEHQPDNTFDPAGTNTKPEITNESKSTVPGIGFRSSTLPTHTSSPLRAHPVENLNETTVDSDSEADTEQQEDMDHVDSFVLASNDSDAMVKEDEGADLVESFDKVTIATETIEMTKQLETVVAPVETEPQEAQQSEVLTEQMADLTPTPTNQLEVVAEMETVEEPLYYIDTEPGLPDQNESIMFDAAGSAPLGEISMATSDEEEEIVLVPRKFKNPEPISLPAEPDYVLSKDDKPRETLTEKFGGKGKERPVATTSTPGKKSKQVRDAFSADEETTTAAKGGPKKNKKQAKREKRKNRKDERMKKTEGIMRHKMPRMDSDVEWGSDGPPEVHTLDQIETDEEDAVPVGLGAKKGSAGLSTKGLTGRKKREMELLMDYLENTVGVEEESEVEMQDQKSKARKDSGSSVAEDIDFNAMTAFAKGMEQQNQVTIDDINDAKRLQEEDEDEGDWVDSSGSELTDDEGDETEARPGLGAKSKNRSRLVEVAPGLLGRQVDDGMDDSFSVDSEDDEDSTDDDGVEMAGMGWAVPASSDSDSETDSDEDVGDEMDDIFKGKNNTWAEAADDFITAMDELVGDDDLMLSTGKKFEKNKLFRAIQNGDFGDDWATKPAPKGKKNKLKGVPKELQAQWEKDRQAKADKKRQRELDRVEQQMSLYPAMRKQGKSKGKRKEIYSIDSKTAGMLSAKEMAKMFDIDSDSEDDFGFGGGYSGRKKGGRGKPPVTDLISLNAEIRVFLGDLGKTTMSLPAMDKFSRKKVHEIADCYSLKSQSKGKGNNRFPILIKTSRSSLEMLSFKTEKKLDAILGARSQGDFYKAKYAKKEKNALPGSTARTGAGTVRHKDGDAVGHGASAIGQDNIGHRLLSKMGWTEGARIGMSGGLDVPIVAIVKNTKLGLGA